MTSYFPIFYFMMLLLVGEIKSQSLNLDTDINNKFDSFDSVLNTFVGNDGTVDYSAIRENPFKLDIFLDFINDVSPETHPELFSELDVKAYWINVYNALAIKTIIDNPDVSSIKEVAWGMGAFWRKKFRVGGRKMTLNHIENKILRKKYQDPRIHFAINCASISCPPIGNRIVTGANLDDQLDKKSADFINDPLNVRIDHENKKIHVSRIFKWYKKDFGQNNDELLDYLFQYLDNVSDELKSQVKSNYKIKYNKYDWSLNE